MTTEAYRKSDLPAELKKYTLTSIDIQEALNVSAAWVHRAREAGVLRAINVSIDPTAPKATWRYCRDDLARIVEERQAHLIEQRPRADVAAKRKAEKAKKKRQAKRKAEKSGNAASSNNLIKTEL